MVFRLNSILVFHSDDNQVLGVVTEAPFQMTWFQVPEGDYNVKAVVEVANGNASLNSDITTYQTETVQVKVKVQPELAAYQTASTDLQLPAPGLPIALARSYSSRDTTVDHSTWARGWKASWHQASLRLGGNLGLGWEGFYGQELGSARYYITEAESHSITITLPDGRMVFFEPKLNYNPANLPYYYGEDGLDGKVNLGFQSYYSPAETLVCDGISNLEVYADYDAQGSAWTGSSVTLGSTNGISPTYFTYTDEGGTKYQFEESNQELVFRLKTVTDRNGYTLTYSYGTAGEASFGQVTEIQHSYGRSVLFAYDASGNTTTNISVFDSVERFKATEQRKAILIYQITDGNLVAVKQFTDRNATTPETTTYEYGNTDAPVGTTPDQAHVAANEGRLTDIIDARGVRVLRNQYRPANVATGYEACGDILRQTDVALGVTEYHLENGELTVSRTINGESKTVQVNHGASGAIAEVTNPEIGEDPGSIASSFVYDERGRLVSQANGDGTGKIFEYDSQDRLVATYDEANAKTSTEYDGNGLPLKVTDANGNSTENSYDTSGNPLRTVDPTGKATTTYTYYDAEQSGGNTVLLKTLKSERQTASQVPFTIVNKYTYTKTGNVRGEMETSILQWEDAEEKVVGTPVTTSYEYDDNGNRTAEIKRRTRLDGKIEFIRTVNAYDAMNRVTHTKIQTRLGAMPWVDVPHTLSRTVYNALGKQKESYDGYNRKTQYIYDVSGNLIETIYPDLTVTRTAYDNDGRAYFVQDRLIPAGNVTSGPATRTSYDASGRVRKVERIASVTFTRTPAEAGADFVSSGNVLAEFRQKMEVALPTAAILTTTHTFYDGRGQVKYSVGPRGNVTENIYDSVGRRKAVRVYEQYTYTGNGDSEPVPAGTCLETKYGYDSNGNQTWVETWTGAADNLALHNRTEFRYDESNRQTRTIFVATGPEASTYLTTLYDGLGQRIREIDEDGVSTTYTYDFRGLLTSVTLAAGTAEQSTTVYGYDELGNSISQKDAKGNTTRYAYDALGRRTHRFLPGATTLSETIAGEHNPLLEKTVYAANENPSGFWTQRKEVTDFRGLTITNIYDNTERLTAKLLPPVGNILGSKVAYGYAPIYGTYQLVSVSQSFATSGVPFRTVSYAYDEKNRLRVKRSPEGTLTYDYNDLGAVTRISARHSYQGTKAYFEDLEESGYDESHAEWNYDYDLLGRLSTVKTNKSAPAEVTYDYNPVGSVETMTYRNGLVTSYTYNHRNWLRLVESKLENTTLAQFDYDGAAPGSGDWSSRRLSSTGQRKRSAELVNGASRTIDYDYDSLKRLVKETINGNGPTGSIDYSTSSAGPGAQGYDLVGNRQTRHVIGSALQSAGVTEVTGDSFDERDLLVGNTYDANGNTLSDTDGNIYEYDAENRLVKRTRSGSPTVYITYDAEGNRVSKTSIGKTWYLVDDQNPTGYAQVVEECQGAEPTVTKVYTYGLDLVKQGIVGGSEHFYGYDGLGSVRYLTTSGTGSPFSVTDTYDYDAFGVLIRSSGTNSNSYRFTGEQWDSHLGMYYLRARYYKPEIGRFWTMDTFEGYGDDPGTLHKYLYAMANPSCVIDPSGNEGESVSTLGAAGITSRLASIAAQTLQRTTAAQRVLKAAFKAKDFTQVGRTFNLYGKIAENAAFNVLRLALRHTGAILSRRPAVGKRFLDYAVSHGGKVLRIEVKYALPKGGPALSRLVGQASASVNQGGARTLIWSLAEPTAAELAIVTEALGVQASSVAVRSGITGLFEYMSWFLAL